ncbi:MAG: hypothetical protein JNK82_13535 [Myxococcaceae bacterium]|nr:hypothetical protein [Myxococcaceae bacterium]
MSIAATVTVSMSMDLTALIDAVARQGKAVAGEAPLHEDELAAVRAAVVLDVKEELQRGNEAVRERITASLGKGIKLLGVSSDHEGLVVTSHTRLAVDDLALLPDVVLAGEQPGADHKPFAGFKVTANSVEGHSPKLPAAPGAKGELVLVLETAKAPASHNATKADGGRLEWRGPLGGAGFPVQVKFES